MNETPVALFPLIGDNRAGQREDFRGPLVSKQRFTQSKQHALLRDFLFLLKVFDCRSSDPPSYGVLRCGHVLYTCSGREIRGPLKWCGGSPGTLGPCSTEVTRPQTTPPGMAVAKHRKRTDQCQPNCNFIGCACNETRGRRTSSPNWKPIAQASGPQTWI